VSVVVYAGSFDPFTNGHLVVVRRAARLFAHVRVLVAVNPNKAPLLPAPERVALIERVVAQMPHVSVAFTTGLVVEHARAIGASVLVRGLRDEQDARAETALAWANEELAPEIATVLLPCPADLVQVSSSRLKEIARAGGDLEHLEQLCPPVVAQRLRAALREEAA
jgi:pantetheine-phosphate adenylyltransferase